MRKTRCAIYIRVSTAMQRMEGWSLDAQRDSLTQLAASKGWEVVGVYADEGKSARKRLKDRQEIFRLLDDVRAGLVDVILFKELDRWFRNVSDFYKVQDVLDEYGVRWYSERQPNLDMSTKEGRLAANIMLSVGQNEADAASERVKYTNQYLRAQRRWTAGRQSLVSCYTLDADQHVIIDPEQEGYTRDLIATFLRTGSIRATAFEVNARWDRETHYTTVKRLLRNPILCGEVRGDPAFVAEPYLSRAEFDELQRRMVRNVKVNSEHVFIFSGLLRCGFCGKRLSGSNSGRGNYPHYRCPHQADTKRWPNVTIGEAKLEKLLLPYVREALDGRIAEITAVRTRKRGRPRKGNRDVIEKRLERLEDLYINDGTMSRERYEAKRQEILSRLIEPERPADDPELKSLEALRQLLGQSFDQIYAGLSPEERRTFWRGILESVTIRTGEITGIVFKA